MTDSSTLTVGLDDRAYDITVGRDLIGRIDEIAGAQLAGRHVVIIADAAVAPHHLAPLESACNRICRRVDSLTVASGEASKSMAVLAGLLEDILALGVDRDVVLVALGGGVIGDLAGFAAASLLRGVDFIQVPTTLLAQVDSSVGGKTGVNAAAGKNLIGAFHQPRAVLIDIDTLATLPARELRAGYAEVIKYGLLGDAAFFEWLEAHGGEVLDRDEAALRHAITTSCTAKARIVEMDEREAGRRALLNLGHTFAHAFESVCGYDGRLLHGEAVGVGMALAYRLAGEMGLCTGQDGGRAAAHIAASGLSTRLAEIPAASASTPALIDIMRRDKKVRNGRMRFVLPRAIGDSFVCDEVPEDMLTQILDASR
ncbi:MAG: 3-dehydroquinate synthase [SAR116 cluster bacterium]|nr:MAG: 3-dehydroquinate synthase [SAR116 cluster bacterium]|tara:strand:- start:14817 stop:15926 length:1110 start_codon:yes stop_codon:yes gene_type:complete